MIYIRIGQIDSLIITFVYDRLYFSDLLFSFHFKCVYLVILKNASHF